MEDKLSNNLIVRIFKLWRVHAYIDFMWMTRDMKFFLVCYIADGFISIAAIMAMVLLAERFDGIGHWSKYQVLFMLGYGSTVGAFTAMFFGYNVLNISRRLGRGQFDHTLIQPQPVWMTLLTEGFTPFCGSCSLIPGIALLIWAMSQLSIPTTSAWYTLLAINFIASCMIMLSFSFIWGSLAFWAPRAAEEISTSALTLISELQIFPLSGLGSTAIIGLMTFVPVGFVAWYPCRSLLGVDSTPWSVLITPAAAVVFATIAAVVFRKGMKYYGQTGSQRYSGWGHRN